MYPDKQCSALLLNLVTSTFTPSDISVDPKAKGHAFANGHCNIMMATGAERSSFMKHAISCSEK
jgi:hypothetical protein